MNLRDGTRTRLLRAGFTDSQAAAAGLDELASILRYEVEDALALFEAGDPEPDQALRELTRLLREQPELAASWAARPSLLRGVITLFATSTRMVEFIRRHPEAADELDEAAGELPTAEGMDARVRAVAAAQEAGQDASARPNGDAVATEREVEPGGMRGEDAVPAPLDAAGLDAAGLDAAGLDAAVAALRVRYRLELAKIILYDMRLERPAVSLHRVAAALANLASSTIDAALALARRSPNAPAQAPQVRLAIIGMGKCGARELNYISDIDVMFVAAPGAAPAAGSDLPTPRAVEVATRLARETMRILMDYAVEPPLWEIDTNLRPEGKDGALVRSLDSYRQYYERWAENWEFMALLKARPIAGDAELGAEFIELITPFVWNAAERESFVASVQRMRARVIEHIPRDRVDRELKLGPGGLRDIEFPVQLLQLVHGQVDAALRVPATLDAITQLATEGHIGRDDAATFADDYRFLRLLEHRVQLRQLTRTHLLPTEPEALRALARGARAASSQALLDRLGEVHRRVRQLHKKLFFRPLVAAASHLDAEQVRLTDERVLVRLRAIGYRDPHGALAHIQALTQGVSRRATIQRNLLPVLLEWFAEGTDPDQGLLAFRKLSEHNGAASWYLRLLRDSNVVARRLCRVLAGSAFCATFLELFPEAVKWLDQDAALRPREREALAAEFAGALARYDDEVRLGRVIRGIRRREVLRLALGTVLGLIDLRDMAAGLTAVAEFAIQAGLDTVRHVDEREYPPLAVIGMGRFGGAELGFGSDLDVLYVAGGDAGAARALVNRLHAVLEDARLPIDLDADLRPEGRAGELVRSVGAYSNYYAKWSLGWEAQALLRARPVAGDARVAAEFMHVADRTRYREAGLSARDLVEIRRIKARVEDERLPLGADPKRHLKLGRGSLSDVEWLVQRWQLEHAHSILPLRTTSTLDALDVAAKHGLVSPTDAGTLRDAWMLASRVRSGVLLASNTQTDVLPGDAVALEAVARLLDYEEGSGVELENDYLAATRRARAVFERRFYGDPA